MIAAHFLDNDLHLCQPHTYIRVDEKADMKEKTDKGPVFIAPDWEQVRVSNVKMVKLAFTIHQLKGQEHNEDMNLNMIY